jgi:hypothetical protein
MIMAGQNEEKYTDQTLLDKIVWPSAQYDVVRVIYVLICCACRPIYAMQSISLN